MMSPRLGRRMGNSFSSQDHWGTAKTNLLTRRWSPIISELRMDADGMVNCWPTKVLKNMMIRMAKQTTSRLSRRKPLATPAGRTSLLSSLMGCSLKAGPGWRPAGR